MNSQIEVMPGAATSVGASARTQHLFRIAYIGASAVAMIGWLIALSWAALSLLGLSAQGLDELGCLRCKTSDHGPNAPR